MALVRWKDRNLYDPWEGFKTLQDEINQLFDVDRVPTSRGLFDRTMSPAIDVIEGAEDISVHCEVPGITLDELDVSIASNVLTIKGNKNKEGKGDDPRYYTRETWSGQFQRTISLPKDVDSEKIEAELRNGILMVTLPKREEAKQKRIAVKVK